MFLGIDAGPPAITMAGDVRLQPGQYVATREYASQCTGTGAFADIAPGARVNIVHDVDPAVILGFSNLSLATIIGNTAATSACVMTFELHDVMGGQRFYRVQIGHTSVVRYSWEQAQLPLVITFDR